MVDKQILLLPGPTQIPPRVALAMAQPAIGHRGSRFKAIVKETTEGLKEIFQTRSDVLILSSSGTGGMEAAATNFISPGEKVLIISMGSFGERFDRICRAFAIETEILPVPYGQAVDPQAIAARLKADDQHEIKAVLVQHNETSTGVLNDIQAISKARGDHPALLIVDTISGLVAANLPVDDWNIDVAIAGSQKAFMLPPGLAMLAVRERAWEAAERCTNRSFYFNLLAARESYNEKSSTPYTPAVSLFYGLRESLKMIKEETLEGSFARHALMRDMVRAGVRALGLELLAADDIASPAVTAVKVPAGVKPGDIRKPLLEKYGVVVAGGQSKVKDKIFRIGHLGFVSYVELFAVLAALEAVLVELDVPVKAGAGVVAAREVLQKNRA